MTVRKNFNFDETTARHLEELAREKGKTQTQVVTEAIEQKYRSLNKDKKLSILDEVSDVFHGMLTDVDAKAAGIEHVMEKYGR